MLLGCGAVQPADKVFSERASEAAQEPLPDTDFAVPSEPDAEKENVEAVTAAEAAAGETPGAAGQAQNQGEEGALESPIPVSEAFIEGNGCFLMRVGTDIYFHRYTREAFPDIALDGAFLGGNSREEEASVLCRYDTLTEEVTEIVPDGCLSELYYCGDRFFYTREAEEEIWTVTPLGEKEKFAPGQVAGVSGDGSRIALWVMRGEDRCLSVYDAQGREASCLTDRSDLGRLRYCGFSEDVLLFTGRDAGNTVRLYSVSPGNEPVCLGMLSVTGTASCDRLVPFSGDVFCLFGWYGGPVNSLEDFLVVRCTPGKEDSLRELQHGYDASHMKGLDPADEPWFRVDAGAVAYLAHEPYSLELTHSNPACSGIRRFVYGDLLLYDGDGNARTLIRDLVPEMDSERLILQDARILGDSAYLMLAQAERDRESDDKIRQAFLFRDMFILRQPLNTETVESLTDFSGRTQNPRTVIGPDWYEVVTPGIDG